MVSAEDAAKAAWLNNQVTANYWPVRRSASHSASEDEAKAAWLATLDKSVPKSPSPSVKDDAKEPTANFEWAEVPTPSDRKSTRLNSSHR